MSKEWKGNSKSVSTMLGMSTVWNPEQRAPGDFYSTDPKAVRTLLSKIVPEWGGVKIWEPACGNGNISKVLEEFVGVDRVVSTDLFDRGYGITGIDFLQSDLPDGVGVIITNPPYSLADEFILHAIDILPENGIYIALQNINYLAGKRRFSTIYGNGLLKKLYVYSGRINCYKNGITQVQSSPVNYGWFVYSKANQQPPQIFWI